MKIPFQWEEITKIIDRAKVIGGWIVRSSNFFLDADGTSMSESMVFIPDPGHVWEIKK